MFFSWCRHCIPRFHRADQDALIERPVAQTRHEVAILSLSHGPHGSLGKRHENKVSFTPQSNPLPMLSCDMYQDFKSAWNPGSRWSVACEFVNNNSQKVCLMYDYGWSRCDRRFARIELHVVYGASREVRRGVSCHDLLDGSRQALMLLGQRWGMNNVLALLWASYTYSELTDPVGPTWPMKPVATARARRRSRARPGHGERTRREEMHRLRLIRANATQPS